MFCCNIPTAKVASCDFFLGSFGLLIQLLDWELSRCVEFPAEPFRCVVPFGVKSLVPLVLTTRSLVF